MRAGAADVVLVLGDIGKMREVGERPDDPRGLARRHAVQQAFQLLPRDHVVVAVEADGGLAHAFDKAEDLFALLFPDGVAQDAPEQPDIVTQRKVLFGHLGLVHDLHDRRLFSAASISPGENCTYRSTAAPYVILLHCEKWTKNSVDCDTYPNLVPLQAPIVSLALSANCIDKEFVGHLRSENNAKHKEIRDDLCKATISTRVIPGCERMFTVHGTT